MTPQLQPMASFSELLRTALGTATRQVAEGSRRNAQQALSTRRDEARASSEVLAALAPAPAHRRPA